MELDSEEYVVHGNSEVNNSIPSLWEQRTAERGCKRETACHQL